VPTSTAQHSTAQHSTAQHSTAQHSTAQHSTAQQYMLYLIEAQKMILWSRVIHESYSSIVIYEVSLVMFSFIDAAMNAYVA
jgi:hypothetical protein